MRCSARAAPMQSTRAARPAIPPTGPTGRMKEERAREGERGCVCVVPELVPLGSIPERKERWRREREREGERRSEGERSGEETEEKKGERRKKERAGEERARERRTCVCGLALLMLALTKPITILVRDGRLTTAQTHSAHTRS